MVRSHSQATNTKHYSFTPAVLISYGVWTVTEYLIYVSVYTNAYLVL